MVKCAALYIAVIISLIIGIICLSLIAAAYMYKSEFQRNLRFQLLQNNVKSGINLLLSSKDSTYKIKSTLSLFENNKDSVSLFRYAWGIFDIGVVNAFIQQDSVTSAFSIANDIDSSKWAVLYLADRDRELDLSGQTFITGQAFIPKAGIKKIFINDKEFSGSENLVTGKKNIGKKELPSLSADRISSLKECLSLRQRKLSVENNIREKDSLSNDFWQPTISLILRKKNNVLRNIQIKGNVIIFSDTTLTIDNTTQLNNVLIFARSIIVKSKFHGKCQMFATDSIKIENDCVFDYPSCLGVINSDSSSVNNLVKITLGDDTRFNGTIFTYQERKAAVLPLISFGKKVIVSGQIYSQGILMYSNSLNVRGSVFTRLFTYRNNADLLENTLIDSKLDSKALSKYYLTSDIFDAATKRKDILQWLGKK